MMVSIYRPPLFLGFGPGHAEPCCMGDHPIHGIFELCKDAFKLHEICGDHPCSPFSNLMLI